MSETRRLPRAGERINRDPLRRFGDDRRRWGFPSRRSALVLAAVDDLEGSKVLVLKMWSPGKGWIFNAMSEARWQHDLSWEIGPLPRQPRKM